jgi:Ca2+-transporting ATPase
MPVGKQTEPLAFDTVVMDRSNMVFKGTAITRGSGKGIVAGIGPNTEFGRVFELVAKAEPQQTPLEKRLNALGNRLAWVVMAVAVILAIGGIAAGRETFLAIEVAIALAVAAIPEGLPVVATIALARGMWRMAARNALISRLSAVETLGATSVILTDKTGTLTENRMTVTEVQIGAGAIEYPALTAPAPAGQRVDGKPDTPAALLDELLTAGVLCSNASLHSSTDGKLDAVGDPMEIALLVAASRRKIARDEVLEHFPELSEVSFDPATKLMATLHRKGSDVLIAVKGAPESVVPRCVRARTIEGDSTLTDRKRQEWLGRAAELGSRGLRTLAIASKVAARSDGDPYSELTLLGLVGLEDPAREGVREAIARCFSAGLTVVMVTGDHAATARQIAADVGMLHERTGDGAFIDGEDLDAFLARASNADLLGTRVFSRVTPQQKLNLIDVYQRHGHVVAMTGDGVNDAPALKKADIGVAMGIRGTAVAKEAAAMVLLDDDFATIVEAISHGRTIFDNLRKFVVYLLSCNISEVLVVSLATVAGAPLPLLPLQILFLNLVTDVFPALALGVGRSSATVMDRMPRPAAEPVLTRAHWFRIGLHGAVISMTVLTAMAVAVFYLEFDSLHAVTVSFCTLALAQLWHVFNMRDDLGRLLNNEITRNIWVWIAIAICLALVLVAVYTPLLGDLLELSDPGIAGWLVILLFSAVPLLLAPAVHFVVPLRD